MIQQTDHGSPDLHPDHNDVSANLADRSSSETHQLPSVKKNTFYMVKLKKRSPKKNYNPQKTLSNYKNKKQSAENSSEKRQNKLYKNKVRKKVKSFKRKIKNSEITEDGTFNYKEDGNILNVPNSSHGKYLDARLREISLVCIKNIFYYSFN